MSDRYIYPHMVLGGEGGSRESFSGTVNIYVSSISVTFYINLSVILVPQLSLFIMLKHNFAIKYKD